MLLSNLAETPYIRRDFGLIKNVAKVQPPGFPMVDGFFDFEAIGPANHFVHLAETELSHKLANFFSDEPHEIGRMLRLAGETFAQLRILRGHADRTGIEMTDAHHNA